MTCTVFDLNHQQLFRRHKSANLVTFNRDIIYDTVWVWKKIKRKKKKNKLKKFKKKKLETFLKEDKFGQIK